VSVAVKLQEIGIERERELMSRRFQGIECPYSAADVDKLRGLIRV
jgi:isocitrate lyase